MITAEDSQYFLEGDILFDQFKNVCQSYGKEHSLLIVLEAVTFQPYFPTSEKEASDYKNIHLDHHYNIQLSSYLFIS